MITWKDFEKVEMRVGTIIEAEDFPEAKNSAYKLKIDFGKLGVKKSSAQVTELYKKEDLLNKQVIVVTNFPPKQIANFVSECLVLGVVLENKKVVFMKMRGYKTPCFSTHFQDPKNRGIGEARQTAWL